MTSPPLKNKPNGIQCTTTDQKNGFCYLGECVPLKCAQGLEGTCGQPKEGILSCCQKGETCYPSSGPSGEICCKDTEIGKKNKTRSGLSGNIPRNKDVISLLFFIIKHCT